jgi:hypothetical protein
MYTDLVKYEQGKFCKNYDQKSAKCKIGCKELKVDKNSICPLDETLQNKCPNYK